MTRKGHPFTFSPEMKQHIINELTMQGMDEMEVRLALAAWDQMTDPSTPVQIGCFRFFASLQSQYQLREQATEVDRAIERLEQAALHAGRLDERDNIFRAYLEMDTEAFQVWLYERVKE